MSKFIITKKSTGEYYFSYKADNGEIILHSEDYSTETECEAGIKELMVLALNPNSYTRVKLPFGYYFQIKSINGMVLATSRIYTIERSVDFEIKRLRNTLAHAPTQFESLEEIIENQNLDIKEKNKTIEKTTERESKGLLNIFDGLKKDFLKEEISWLFVVLLVVLFLVTFFSISIARFSLNLSWLVIVGLEALIVLFLYIINLIYQTNSENGKTKKNGGGGKQIIINFFKKTWNFIVFVLLSIVVIGIFTPKINSIVNDFKNIPFCHSEIESNSISPRPVVSGEPRVVQCIDKNEYLLIFSPLILLFISLLWFSVHQYGRAKKLRIEQQNKQAMIHYMQAIIAQDGKGSKNAALMPKLAPFFANAIIHRPFSQENYEPQLPVDNLVKWTKDAKDILE